ncbi:MULTISPECIES: GNAT family N-acetyltransferase [Sinorhizobium]|uniref:GNAT family N-acetyltransferase n=1 Tax=Sinorhizobium psoraleae TaxID=520838 RepID=A0ABT4KLH2_9HYPH|nr:MULTISPECIES: GNAT family N-acetyltransferase [Sinorhizobium]MCZ4092807.1 GNAT family N-acetyltransferase [Sinorhizobium psoraleae]MDK1386450.1 N-acetyltransferase family protein [Sinorhizobium sp. 7-81]
MQIRDAVDADIEAIRDIYNDAVANTTAIWNETVVDVANRAAWLKARKAAGFPVLVAQSETGEVIGYASFGEWRAFDGYRHTVEHSVYVRSDRRGGGIGRALMVALIERAEALGKHVMVAGIESSNLPSIRLHEQLGFKQTGHMKEVGTKFGRWLDLTFMQLVLRTGSPN